MKVDLQEEAFAAAARVRAPHRQRMIEMGVPLHALADLGQRQPPFGLQRVQETSGGLYEPAENGLLAIVLPVLESRWIDYSGLGTEIDEIVDLIAFRSSNPLSWRWRIGDGWALGASLLDHDAPVDVVASPLAWLAAAGRALCLLDWDLSPQRWAKLREAPPLVTSDNVLRRRINGAFAKCVPPLVIEPNKWIYKNGRYVRAA